MIQINLNNNLFDQTDIYYIYSQNISFDKTYLVSLNIYNYVRYPQQWTLSPEFDVENKYQFICNLSPKSGLPVFILRFEFH